VPYPVFLLFQGEESMVRVEENGELVLVVEKKKLNSGHRIGQIVLRVSISASLWFTA